MGRISRGFRRTVMPTLIGVAWGIAGLNILGIISRSTADPIESVFLRKKIENVVRRQEKTLGIRHFGEPRITLDAPRQDALVGRYSTFYDNVWVRESEEDSITIAHELGHWYADKLSESLGNGSWPSIWKFFKKKREKVISEGIAAYFEYRTFGDSSKRNLWHSDFEGYPRDEYGYAAVGYEIVAPILDQSIDRGIEFLIKNPPKKRDMKDHKGYRERILRMMDEEKQ